jgi:DNA-binding NarL/FixJ family response regulator
VSSRIKVVIVDDDPLVRSALTLMLGGQSDLTIVGDAPDGRAGLELITRERPDVVLMDIRMPRLGGLEATQELHQQPDPPRVIVLTTFDADDYVMSAIGAGADGFLLKDTPPDQIVDAIRRVASGEAMLSPSVTRTVVSQLRNNDTPQRLKDAQARLEGLTPRELEVAIAVGGGLSNADIAGELFMSVATVKAHVSRLFDKLGATNRVQIAICVHDAGLV